MRQIGVLFSVLVCMVVYAPIATADLESLPLRRPTHSLAEQQPPENRLYTPSWADRFGRMPDLGVNDDATQFDFGDEDSGRSPLDSDDF